MVCVLELGTETVVEAPLDPLGADHMAVQGKSLLVPLPHFGGGMMGEAALQYLLGLHPLLTQALRIQALGGQDGSHHRV